MRRYDSRMLHVRPDVHERVKRFCQRNDIRMGTYVMKALRRQVTEDEEREQERLRNVRLRDERERQLYTREVIAVDAGDSAIGRPPFWSKVKA